MDDAVAVPEMDEAEFHRQATEWEEITRPRLAAERLEAGDVEGWLGLYSNEEGPQLLHENFRTLRERGYWERALVHAWPSIRTNWSGVPAWGVRLFFRLADRDALLKAGEPLPDGAPWRVYRGVAGKGHARRVNSYAWTRSLDTACWFAMRHAERLGDPAVYVRDVTADDVYFYDNGREEQEFVLVPAARSPKRASLDAAEIRHRAEQVSERRRIETQERLMSLEAANGATEG